MMNTETNLTLVTGGAGYLGLPVVHELLETGRGVRVLDALIHGQDDLIADLESRGAEVLVGDIRDDALRAKAVQGVDSIIHLAAIVGDPACARDPETAQAVNVDATAALVRDATEAGVRRLLFASTCSNYGRMSDPTVPIVEDGVLAPVSLYAEQKVAIEQSLLGHQNGGPKPTCLRFATLYGVAPRMRFDLTVNEFTRDLWADRELDVFGEQFWRPYVHVRDAARAVRLVVDSPVDRVGGRVFNVGRSTENYRKLDVVEIIREQTDRGTVSYVRRDEDPRDYKVSFDRINSELGFDTTMMVRDGVSELLSALEANAFDDPFDARYRNIP
jgi:nucleoside-diphosphate-sugar epimerase